MRLSLNTLLELVEVDYVEEAITSAHLIVKAQLALTDFKVDALAPARVVLRGFLNLGSWWWLDVFHLISMFALVKRLVNSSAISYPKTARFTTSTRLVDIDRDTVVGMMKTSTKP